MSHPKTTKWAPAAVAAITAASSAPDDGSAVHAMESPNPAAASMEYGDPSGGTRGDAAAAATAAANRGRV